MLKGKLLLGVVALALIFPAQAQEPGSRRSDRDPSGAARLQAGDDRLGRSRPAWALAGRPSQRHAAATRAEQGNRVFLTDEEMAARAQRIEAAAARYYNETAGDRLGQGHRVEMGVPNRRTSLIVRPASGDDRGRQAPLRIDALELAFGPNLRLDDRFRQLGPVHHARASGLDAADAVQQRHPHFPGARVGRHPARDDP